MQVNFSIYSLQDIRRLLFSHSSHYNIRFWNVKMDFSKTDP